MEKYKCVSKGKESFFDEIEPQKEKTKISIILPTFNEEKNIRELVKSISSSMKHANCQIVIVDDESKDRTPQIIDELVKSNNVTALHRYGVKGIFSAKMDGILFSNSETIVVMDADFSHPPKLIPEMLKYAEDYDIVSGSRYIEMGEISAPLRRVFGSKLINTFVRLILGLKSKDVTGGFHIFKKSKFLSLEFKYKSRWEESDMELFYRAERKNYKIKEIPFAYKFRSRDTFSSKIVDFWYGLRYIFFAIKLRVLG